MSKSSFWQKDQEEISRISQQRASLREKIDLWKKLFQDVEEGKILAEMAFEDSDEHTLRDVEKDIDSLQENIMGLEFQSLLPEPDDRRLQSSTVPAADLFQKLWLFRQLNWQAVC